MCCVSGVPSCNFLPEALLTRYRAKRYAQQNFTWFYSRAYFHRYDSPGFLAGPLASAPYGEVVRQQLQRNGVKNRE